MDGFELLVGKRADLTLENSKGKNAIDVTSKLEMLKFVEDYVERKQQENRLNTQQAHRKMVKQEEAKPVEAL
jgi:hypothetical protein